MTRRRHPSTTLAPARATRRTLVMGLAGAALSGVTLAPRVSAADFRPAPTAQPRVETLTVLRSRIELQIAPGFSDATVAAARPWVLTSCDAVARYFGRFPVSKVELLLVPEPGSDVRGGVTYAAPSLLIRIRLGHETTAAQFADDWVLVHEMVHLALPRVPRGQNWLHEGVATYVESIARGRMGLVSADAVWREWRRAMPQGQPKPGDAGLDHTPTWGRTYWGGAIFCLLADVALLRRSAAQSGLQQALQGVLAEGGNYGVEWSVERILAVADASVGGTTLTELYQRMKDSPEPVDLDTLWRDLGVDGTTLNDAAPLAAVRRAILS